jgi:3'(2'), 5'-bisphosphate nucleotidase
MTTTDDAALAEVLALEAGELLLAVRDGEQRGRELGNAGDRRAQHLLATLLHEHRPDDAVLSEEAVDDPARLQAERVWIIDPLDGTREYGEPPRSDWAVHVALWQNGALAAGAVALPALGVVHGTGSPSVVPERAPGPLRIAVSRSRPPEFVAAVAADLGADLVPMGSAGYKALAVLRGDVDAYLHAGGQYEWDSAAPVAVCRAAGLHCSRVDGSELRYNRPDPLLPDLLVCRSGAAADLLRAVAAAGSTEEVVVR